MKKDLAEMSTLDVFLSSLSKREYEKLKQNIGSRKAKSLPLMSWDAYMEGYYEQLEDSRRKIEMDKVLSFAQRFEWKNDLKQIFTQTDYEALIITDVHQKIIWVNEGFTDMTGYSKRYAVYKTPRFLQGPMTSSKTKQRIKKNIELDIPFKDVIINHKKDNSIYKCEVNIFPLYSDKTTHYIAFERKVG